MLNHRFLAPAVIVAVAACGEPASQELVTVESQRSLRAMLSDAQVVAVGVTVDPLSAEQYVLDNNKGLLRVGETVEVVAGPNQLLLPNEQKPEFTDVVALGDGRFAMTIVNDGYLLDLNEGSFEQFFCYEPGWIPDMFPAPAVAEQITNSLAYDAKAGVMYAQPQTFVTEDGVRRVELSQVGEFDARNGGEGYGWIDLDTEINAGGLAVYGNDQLLLGIGSELHQLNLQDGVLSKLADLAEFGVERIDGITALSADRLVILDGAQSELLTIRLNPDR